MRIIVPDDYRADVEDSQHPILSESAAPPARGPSLNNLLITGVIAVSTLAVLALFAFLYFARAVLVPIALGMFFAYILAPLVALLRRAGGMPHGAAVFIVIVATLASAGMVGWLAYGEAVSFAGRLPVFQDKLAELADQMMAPVRLVEDAAGTILPASEAPKAAPGAAPTGTADDPFHTRPVKERFDLLPTVVSYLGGAIGLVEDVAIILFVGIFALTGWEMFREKLLSLAGRHRFDVALNVLGGIHTGIQGYLWGMFLIAVIVGVGTTALLVMFGVPYAFLWGVLGGVLAFVPYVGVPLAIIPPLLVGHLNGLPPSSLTAIAIIYFVFRTIEGQYIVSMLLGRHVDMNPLAVLLSLIFWGWLWGPVGLIIGVPLTMVAIVVCDQLPGFAFVGELLGAEGHTRAGTIITPGSAAAAEPPPPDEEKPLITTS